MDRRTRDSWEGRTISHYRVHSVLGVGGMSVVYRAWDLHLDRPVALKVLAPELCRDPDARARFLREAHAASKLDHPNVCAVHEVDEAEEGEPFIAMALYEGRSVRELLREGPRPVGEALELATQAARGLAYLRGAGAARRSPYRAWMDAVPSRSGSVSSQASKPLRPASSAWKNAAA